MFYKHLLLLSTTILTEKECTDYTNTFARTIRDAQRVPNGICRAPLSMEALRRCREEILFRVQSQKFIHELAVFICNICWQ